MDASLLSPYGFYGDDCVIHNRGECFGCLFDSEDDVRSLIRVLNEAQGVILCTAQSKVYIGRSELKEFDGKAVGMIALASLAESTWYSS